VGFLNVLYYLACVLTTVNENQDPDLSLLDRALKAIAFYLIIVGSTVFPEACMQIVPLMPEEISRLTSGNNSYSLFFLT